MDLVVDEYEDFMIIRIGHNKPAQPIHRHSSRRFNRNPGIQRMKGYLRNIWVLIRDILLIFLVAITVIPMVKVLTLDPWLKHLHSMSIVITNVQTPRLIRSHVSDIAEGLS